MYFFYNLFGLTVKIYGTIVNIGESEQVNKGKKLYIGLCSVNPDNFYDFANKKFKDLSIRDLNYYQEFDYEGTESVSFEINNVLKGNYWLVAFIDVDEDEVLNFSKISDYSMQDVILYIYPYQQIAGEDGDYPDFDLHDYEESDELTLDATYFK